MSKNKNTENIDFTDTQDIPADSLLENQNESLNLDLLEEPMEKRSGVFSFIKNIFKKSEKNDLSISDISENIQATDESIILEEKNKNSDYINISDNKNAEDIFSELGDLDFGQINQENVKEKQSVHPLIKTLKITTSCFWILLIIVIVLFFDSYIKTTNNNSVISFLFPICNYISYPIDNYDNSDCKTIPDILSSFTQSENALEEELIINLKRLIPRKMQVYNVISSAEVKFIQEKVGEKIAIVDVIDKFNEIKNNVKFNGIDSYKGQDIDCSNFNINEKGELDISCTVLGGSLSDISSKKSSSSRITALHFLNDLQAKNSNFIILKTPKDLSITKYSNSETGLKGAFSTSTPLDLKLKFISSNNKI